MSVIEARQDFMDRMDVLWAQFDFALQHIPDGDATAFKNYADLLDKFFVCYWNFFDAMNGSPSLAEFGRIADAQHDESRRQLEEAWRNTVDAQFRLAKRQVRVLQRRRSRSLPAMVPVFNEVTDHWKDIRNIAMLDGRIDGLMQVAASLKTFSERVAATT